MMPRRGMVSNGWPIPCMSRSDWQKLLLEQESSHYAKVKIDKMSKMR